MEKRNIFDIKVKTSEWDIARQEEEKKGRRLWHLDQREFHVKVSMIKQLNKQHFAYFGSSTGSRFLVIFLVFDMASQGVMITNSG